MTSADGSADDVRDPATRGPLGDEPADEGPHDASRRTADEAGDAAWHSTTASRTGFDRGAAITRSLLGYGVLAGGFYLAFGLVLAITRDGFDLTQHALSLLMLGDGGWLQRTNLIVTAAMVAAAAVGVARAMRGHRRATPVAALLGAYAAALLASGLFAPDPVDGFPPGATAGDPTLSGIVHLAAGGIGFLALAIAALLAASWFADRGATAGSLRSRAAGLLILVGFVGGAALATSAVGVALLWLAVVTGFAWLAGTSVALYRSVPHPDLHRR